MVLGHITFRCYFGRKETFFIKIIQFSTIITIAITLLCLSYVPNSDFDIRLVSIYTWATIETRKPCVASRSLSSACDPLVYEDEHVNCFAAC